MRHHFRTLMVPSLLLAVCTGSPPDDSAELARAPGGESVAVVRDCPRRAAPGRGAARAEVRQATDVVYARAGGEAQRLDIAWPRAGGPHPLVVLLHGGAWAGGGRLAMRAEMLRLAEQGYVAAAVGYRLTDAPRNVFPAAVRDVRCAVRWLRSRADEYGIDPARVAAAGFSAGGHLAAMLGVAADAEALDDGCPEQGSTRVSAVISFAGPQDLRVTGPYTEEQARLVTNFLGVFPGDDPAVAALASPVAHASAGDSPFLLIHGTEDELVPVEQSRRMALALRRAGVPATVLELRGLPHTFLGLATSGDARVRCTVMAFLGQV